MVQEYIILAKYVIASRDQRYIRELEVSFPQSFDINGKHSRLLRINDHSLRWAIRASLGHRIVIEINQSCTTDVIRLCDGPGILQCHDIEQNCQHRIYSLEYFFARIDIYREPTMNKSSAISFNTTLVAVSKVTVTSPLALLVLSRPSAIMHKSFQITTDQAIQINFNIREFSGLDSEICISGGKINRISSASSYY